MRDSNDQKLGDILKEIASKGKIRDKLGEEKLRSIWLEEMGEFIASRTSKIEIRNKVVFVKVTSSVLRQELFMAREQIKVRIQEIVGVGVVKDVVVR